MSTEQSIAAIDLGKSRCRLAVFRAEGRDIYSGVGSPGLATADGVDTALAAIMPLLEQVGSIRSLGIGAAGGWASPEAALALARLLAQETGARVAVASDVVTAHAGALEGASGTLLIAGTGAVALGVDAEGARLVDGWGPELGDLGSGSWIGREAIRATLRARDGLAGETALSAAVHAHISPAPDAITWLAGDTPVARQLASLAPLVLDAAASEDAVSAGIVDEAVRLLTASAVAASDVPEVAVHGGLTDHCWFRSELERSLASAGRTIVSAVGDALDGAALLARRTDMPHERFVRRAE